MKTTGYPLQYIIGSVNFMGFELKIAPGVFIPRPETELLVETAIRYISSLPTTYYLLPTILDLCTGSANIAIALAKHLTDSEIIASDISDEALKIAEENIRMHKCNNIKLIKSDLFEGIEKNKFDIIISNPPYVSQEDYKELMPEVLHEPKVALDGGGDGLKFYKRILEKAHLFLKENGYLIMEIAYNQAGPVRKLAGFNGFYIEKTVKDYNNIDRIIVIRNTNG